MTKISMTDIVIIGAGMAGLTCAQKLTKAGYSVKIIEKSRGVGGRVATRRLYDTRADHGACYIKPKGELLQNLVDELFQKGILQVWTDTVYQLRANASKPIPDSPSPRYIAPDGMSAIAKFIAKDLDIHFSQRASKIASTPDSIWQIITESGEEFTAKALAIAIPAPQAVEVLDTFIQESLLKERLPLNGSFLDKLKSADYYPSISVMAGYPKNINLPEWKALTFSDDKVLGWIGVDSSKRIKSSQPLLVFQSSANFAQKYFESLDLQAVGEEILKYAAQCIDFSWMNNPEFIQVHRWRYAFPRHPLAETYLSADTELPLVCCGDWCGGELIGGAMKSGYDAAEAIKKQLDILSTPKSV
ncbi:MAG: FAD-dependent oxidoreductase [Cyanobacteria bacterium P01_A01_bin.45]